MMGVPHGQDGCPENAEEGEECESEAGEADDGRSYKYGRHVQSDRDDGRRVSFFSSFSFFFL